jgi:hypothetical protein
VPPTSDLPATPRTGGGARRAAAAVCAVQALFLLGFCAFSLVELARGGSDDSLRVVMEVVLVAAFAAGLLALARAWLAGGGWPSTPTVVWNVLLLPVAWGLVQGGRGALGALVAAVALVGAGAALVAGRDGDETTGDASHG